MTRRFSIRRLTFAGVGVAIAGVGVSWILQGVEWEHRFEEWLTDEPVRVRIDPTVTATYSVPFHQTCSIAHAQRLILEPAAPIDPAVFIAASDSLRVSFSLHDAEGNTTEHTLLGPIFANEETAEVLIERLLPPRDGEYTLTFTVQPSTHPEMPTVADLVIRNELCGLELLPAVVYRWTGIGAIVVGSISTVGAQPWRRPRSPLTPGRASPPASMTPPSASPSPRASPAASSSPDGLRR